jgi:hypothetical protein
MRWARVETDPDPVGSHGALRSSLDHSHAKAHFFAHSPRTATKSSPEENAGLFDRVRNHRVSQRRRPPGFEF